MAQRVKVFVVQLARKHMLAAVKHPHHYVTALILTLIFLAMGDMDRAAITGTWLYAFVETVVSGGNV